MKRSQKQQPPLWRPERYPIIRGGICYEQGKDELAKALDAYKEACLMVIMEGALCGNTDRINDGMEALDLVERADGYISDLTDTFEVLNDKMRKLLDVN